MSKLFSSALPWSPSGVEMFLRSILKPAGAHSFQHPPHCSLATSVLSLDCGLGVSWRQASCLTMFVNPTMVVKRKVSLMFTWDMLNKAKEVWERIKKKKKKRREGRKPNSALAHDAFWCPCHQLGKCKEASRWRGTACIEGIINGLHQWMTDLDWLLRMTYKYHSETTVPPGPFSNPELLSLLCAMALL